MDTDADSSAVPVEQTHEKSQADVKSEKDNVGSCEPIISGSSSEDGSFWSLSVNDGSNVDEDEGPSKDNSSETRLWSYAELRESCQGTHLRIAIDEFPLES